MFSSLSRTCRLCRDERRAHRQRERAVVAVALLVHLGEADVVGALALALDPGVLQPRSGRRRDLGDGVGPVGLTLGQGHITLDHRSPCSPLHHDQVARMDGCSRGFGSGDEHEMHRTREVVAGGHVHHTAVAERRGVEGGERTALDRRMPAQVRPQQRQVGPKRLGHAGDRDTRRQQADRPECRAVRPVDEDQRAPLRMAEDERRQAPGVEIVELGRRRPPDGLGDGPDRREPPLFIPAGRESGLPEPLGGSPAHPFQPLGAFDQRPARVELEIRNRDSTHADAPAAAPAASTHS